MIYNVLNIYNVTQEFKKLIFNLSIIIIDELSIVSIFVANLLQFESHVFSECIIFLIIYAKKQKVYVFNYFLSKQYLVNDFHNCMNYCNMLGGIS